MLGDYLRETLVCAVTVAGECTGCGGDTSAEAKSKFIDGWVRRYRKGLREGGAAGLAYRRERKINCPQCGLSHTAAIPSDSMDAIMGLIKDTDPLFLRAQVNKEMAKLRTARKKYTAAAHHSSFLMGQQPYFCTPRPSQSVFDIVAGWFSKSRKARRQEEIAAQMQEYESAYAAHNVRRSEWTKTCAAAHEKERQCAEELSAAQNNAYAVCNTHGILPLVFPDFVRSLESMIGKRIVAPLAEEPVRRSAAKTRKRGAAGVSVGPGGVRPWVRVGGMGMSFGKTGIGLFARKGPFAIYAKNGKIRVGGRLFRF